MTEPVFTPGYYYLRRGISGLFVSFLTEGDWRTADGRNIRDLRPGQVLCRLIPEEVEG